MSQSRRSRGAGSRSTPAVGVSAILNRIAEARNEPPPPAVSSLLGKRTRSDDDDADDEHDDLENDGLETSVDDIATSSEDLAPTSVAPQPLFIAGHNLKEFAQTHASAQKLTTHQVQDVTEFATDSVQVQAIKLFTAILALQNRMGVWEEAQPALSESSTLKINLKSLAFKMLLSTNISQYKGEDVKNQAFGLAQARGWIPATIEEDNPAEATAIKKFITTTFTQLRSDIKKKIEDSAAGDSPENMWRISKLALSLGTKQDGVKLCSPLCGRLALFRAVYCDHSGDEFWDYVDATIQAIRQAANYDVAEVHKSFAVILADDRKTYGVALPPGDREKEQAIMNPQDLNGY
ncbi:hypothetical protein BC629DRAFT_1599128 [Irpex lacteus]|nr:hypothetical protein BC629DRAFT_1599128 [Irpex lacteus]